MYQDTIYLITNKNSGETKEVIYSETGGDYAIFTEQSTGEKFRFENPNKNETDLSNPDWTIARK